MLLALSLVLAQGITWTVDDDGPADFHDLPTAVAIAADGDRVLVQSGAYQPFQTTKSLTIVGPAGTPAPRIQGHVTVSGANGFALAGLEIDSASFVGVSGALRIDDCVFRKVFGGVALNVHNCELVLLSRLSIDLDMHCVHYAGGTALRSSNSVVSLTDSRLRGPRGCITSSFEYDWGDGGRAAQFHGGIAVVAGTHLLGNIRGATCGPFGCTSCCYGVHGEAVWVRDGARVWLRGDGHTVKGHATAAAASVHGNTSVLVHSGVQLGGPVLKLTAAAQAHAVAPEPFLDIAGDDAPGSIKHVRIHGAGDTPWVMLGSFGAASTPLPPGGLGTPVWIDAFAPVLVWSGTIPPLAPSVASITLPSSPALAGLALRLQAFFPLLPDALTPGAMVASNAGVIVLRY